MCNIPLRTEQKSIKKPACFSVGIGIAVETVVVVGIDLGSTLELKLSHLRLDWSEGSSWVGVGFAPGVDVKLSRLRT